MPAGKFDKRVAIQTRGSTEDAGGNVLDSWTTEATRWGSLEDTGGKELYRAQQVDATVDSVVTLRDQYDGLNPEQRLAIDSRTFAIKAVHGKSDRNRRRGQMVYCTEDV